ncbi:MAG: serine hydrolase [Candidatus Aminicenantes bacterium]|nr:serine hydrolase [Candidatus Aminicenantes bacterium]
MSRVTVRDCLTHRVGCEPLIMPWILTDFNRDELIRRYRHARSLYGFRSTFDYNNTMFIVAGQIIPAVTGKSWDEFVRERIFDPLGMTSSSTNIKDFPESANLACPHEIIDGRIRPIPWQDLDGIGPAGSINSNVSDMVRWLRFQLGKGQIDGKRLLSPKTFKEMHSPQQIIKSISRWGGASPEVCFYVISLAPSRFLSYGLAWFVQEYRGKMLVHHGGDGEGMRCQVGMIPEMNLGVVILSNLHPATLAEALLYRIFDSFIGGEARDWSGEVLASVKAYRAKMATAQKNHAAAPVKKAPPSLALDKYAGVYENDLYGRAEVTCEQGKLMIRLGRIRSRLEHLRSETFRIAEPIIYVGRMPVTFSWSTEGKPESLNVLGILTFTRK